MQFRKSRAFFGENYRFPRTIANPSHLFDVVCNICWWYQLHLYFKTTLILRYTLNSHAFSIYSNLVFVKSWLVVLCIITCMYFEIWKFAYYNFIPLWCWVSQSRLQNPLLKPHSFWAFCCLTSSDTCEWALC